jgi:outer membrane protein OmpA-like peptidoglycan-associated protein
VTIGMSCPLLAACALVLRVEIGIAQTTIPLCAGLTIIGAVSEPEGDYEPIITVTGIDSAGIHLHYASEVRTPSGSLRKVSVRRTVRSMDLDSATLMMQWFDPRAPVVIPGSTAIGTSRAVLRALKTRGTAELGLVDRENSALPNVYDYRMVYELRRVTEEPGRLPVLVNGAQVQLPVIHASGGHMGDKVEFFLLDDEANPLGLRFQLEQDGLNGAAAVSRTIKISYRCRSPDPTLPAAPQPSGLEQALLRTGRAEVYDIYFDFNSDRIREPSEPTLREIAELLRRHPDWRLGIEGHTDSIASDKFNLELSARRAAAVKTTLTGRFGVAVDRLTASGAGESRPKDRNDTVEGRARNRRVELVRLP